MITIVIHLESISMIQLQQFPELYNKLYNLPVKRSWFTNFYSTCTSTIMSIADVLSGDMSRYEQTVSLSHLIDSKPNDLLLSKAIPNTKALFYPPFWNDDDLVSLKHLLNNIEVFSSYRCFREEICNYIKQYNESMLFIYDGSSSLAMMEYDENKSDSYLEQWYQGKLHAIETVHFVIEYILANGLENNVQLLIYGDHGNDFLTHKSRGGHTHCFEPFSNLTHVPLIYYHPLLQNQQVESVFGMENIYDLVMNGLRNDMNDELFLNFLQQQKSFVCARNLYAMQSDSDMHFRKAYSITEGTYNLIVSSNGVEMYASVFDPTNHCNLLNFFIIESDGNLAYNQINVSEGMSKQFSYVLNEKRAKEIIDTYNILKFRLCEVIKELEDGNNNCLLEELNFKAINYC